MFPKSRHVCLSAITLLLTVSTYTQEMPPMTSQQKGWVAPALGRNIKFYAKAVNSLKENFELSKACQRVSDNYVELKSPNNSNDLTAMQATLNTSNNMYLIDPRNSETGACSNLYLTGSYEKSLENSIPEISLYNKLNDEFREKFEVSVRKDEAVTKSLKEFKVIDIGEVFQQYFSATFDHLIEKYNTKLEEKNKVEPIKTKKLFQHFNKFDAILEDGCHFFVEKKENIVVQIFNNFEPKKIEVNTTPDMKRLMQPHVMIYPFFDKEKYVAKTNSVFHKTDLQKMHKVVVNCPLNLWTIHHRLNEKDYQDSESLDHARRESINLILAQQYAYLYYTRGIRTKKPFLNEHFTSLQAIAKPYKLKKKEIIHLTNITKLIKDLVLDNIEDNIFEPIYPQLRSVVEMIVIHETR